MKAYYDAGPCGTGKTHRILTNICTIPGRYLFAVERRESADARLREIEKLDPPAALVKLSVYGEAKPVDGVMSNVVERIRRTMDDFKGADHVILFITHEALLSGRLVATGWHLVIDEMPQILKSGRMLCADQHLVLSRYYNLVPTRFPGFSEIKPCAEYTPKFIANRGVMGLASAHAIWSRHPTYVPFEKWSDCAEMTEFVWMSPIEERVLTGWTSVRLLANGAGTLASMDALKSLCPCIQWRDMTPSASADGRAWKCRNVHVIYFASDHEAKITSWRAGAGKKNLQRVVDYLARVLPDDSIWTVNAEFKAIADTAKIRGIYLTPRQSGQNIYQDRTSVAAILACKPAPDELKTLTSLVPALTAERITAERETETLVQFVMRAAPRDPNSDLDVTIYVYDHKQAAAVARYLNESYPDGRYNVDVRHQDIGVGLPLCGRPRKEPRTEAERKRDYRRRQKQKKLVGPPLTANSTSRLLKNA